MSWKLTYDKLNNRLVATYNTGVTKTIEDAENTCKEYENVTMDYQDALEEYAAALGDEEGRAYTTLHTDKDLADATKALREVVDALLKAQNAETAAKAAYDKAKAEAEALKIARRVGLKNCTETLHTVRKTMVLAVKTL